VNGADDPPPDELDLLARWHRGRGWHPAIAYIEAAKDLDRAATSGAGAGPAPRAGTTHQVPA
jgi:hypothetical protein